MHTIAITQDKLDCCVSYVKQHNGEATRQHLMQHLMQHLHLSESTVSILVAECKKRGLIKDTKAERVLKSSTAVKKGFSRYGWIQSKLYIPDKKHKQEKNYLEGWNGAPILGCYNTKRIYEWLHDEY